MALIAVAGLMLIAMVGLGLDTSQGLLAGHQLQNAADAASLAGALVVKNNANEVTRDRAILLASANKAVGDPVQLSRNDANDPAGDIIIGRFYRFADPLAAPPRCPTAPCFFPQLETPNADKVVPRRTQSSLGGPVAMLFGPAFGVNTVGVSRSAIAISAGTTGAGILVLCPSCECALKFGGNTDLVLQSAPGWDGNTAIQVNSNDTCAVCGSGDTLTVEAPETNIVGRDPGYCFTATPDLNTILNPDSPPMPDPLAGLPAPSWGAPNIPDIINDTTIVSVPATFSPGYYPGGIRITDSEDSVTLLPGIYVVDGEGLYVNGGNLTAHGVMFYVIGTGRVYLGGNGIIDITPSEVESDPYWGISIFQARDNSNPATIIGTSTMNLEGTYYFPVAPVEIGGEGISIGNQLIAWSMWIHGRGTFTIQYDGKFPANGIKVFLVQ